MLYFILLVIYAILEFIIVLFGYLKRCKMDKKYQYNKKYAAENVVQINLKFNKNTDQEIISFIESLDNKQAFFKELIKKELTELNK